MSELDKQLKFLKSTFPSSDNRELKGIAKVSFLFSPTMAATQSYDQVRLIALDGLTELEKLDSRFRSYRDALFGEKSISFNRELKTENENAILNKSIDSFVNLLSPYYLLTPAHKVIEYLLRRYL
jgi:U3 small nucleolar RNA-associated protein 10